MSANADHTADIVIVGGGLEGLAIAWSLASRGVTDVIVLERGTLCSGMTAKSSGIVRCHYGVRSLAAMAWHGVQVFSQAEELFDGDIGFRPTGYVVGVGAENVDALRANVKMNREVGVDVEQIDHDRVATFWPTARLDDFAAFAYEPHGGHGDAYLTGMAFARTARRLGVRIHQQSPVHALRQSTAGAVSGVDTADGGYISAGTVILAAGVWTAGLAETAALEVPVQAQREQILLVQTDGSHGGGAPAFSDLIDLQYFRHEPSGELLVGNSDHSTPELVHPDSYRNRADEDFVESAIGKLDHRLPLLPDPRITTSYAGCYDITPDYNPIIGPSPLPGLFLAAGFSGHGFKVSPAVGRLAADLLLDGISSDQAIEGQDFRLERFAEGKPLTSTSPYVGAGEMR